MEIIIRGQKGEGKSYLARKIAKSICKKENKKNDYTEAFFSVSKSAQRDTDNLLSQVRYRAPYSKGVFTYTCVIIEMENEYDVPYLRETIKRVKQKSGEFLVIITILQF